MAEHLNLPVADEVGEELWRRAETRREAALADGLGPLERSSLSLLLSMARLAAQQDACAPALVHQEEV